MARANHSRIYDLNVRILVSATEDILLRNFADAKLPLVVAYLRDAPMFREDGEYPKSTKLLSVTVQRKNQRREP